jgi:Ran GTPase-activating protein (RanGAP) involved in mRNA processing and transport
MTTVQAKQRPSILYCPVGLEFEPCDPAELTPIIEHLNRNSPVQDQVVFPRGTHLEDGRLDLCKQCIGPEGAAKVAVAVANNSQTRHWLLGANGLGNQGAESVAKATRENTSLETIYLGCNLIDEHGAKPLADALKQNDHVTGLWLKRNPIGVEGAKCIVEMLRQNDRLRTLDLVHTRIGSVGVQLIAKQLTQPQTSVRRLYLGGNKMGPHEVQYIADMLAVNQSIHSLYLGVNRLGCEGLKILADAIAGNRTIFSLSVSSNQIGEDGIWSLVEKIQSHPTLEDLDLGYDKSTKVLGEQPNRYGDAGAFALAELIESNSRLRRLNIRGSGVTSIGADRISMALEQNTNLTRLTLGQGISRSIKQKINSQLERNAKSKPEFSLPDYQDILAIKSVYRS